MNISFEGKRILVTGAGRGIGRELCKVLANSSPKTEVIALSMTQAHLDTLKGEVPSIKTVCVDLSDWEKTREVIKGLLPIHCLVNNAATALLEPFLEASQGNFDKTFDLNVKAVFNVSQIVAKDLVERKCGGSIVNISSQASQAALKDHLAYCGSKAAVDMISKVMALELGPHNIRVNCVNPTVVLTDMGKIGWSDPQKAGPMLAKIPLGRFAEVEDVVHAIIFLLSDKAAMINATTLPVDGGFLAT